MSNSTVFTVVYIIFFIAIIYFLIVRPNNKKKKEHAAMMDNMTIGTEIVTISGLHGEISRIKEDTVWLRVSNNVDVEIDKQAIARVVPK